MSSWTWDVFFTGQHNSPKHVKQSIRLMTDLSAWYYCYKTCCAQIPAAAVTGIKGTPVMGIGSISGSGSHSLLCALLCISAGHTPQCFLSHLLCVFMPLDWIPHLSGVQPVGFPSGSCCLPLQFSSHSTTIWGCCLTHIGSSL